MLAHQLIFSNLVLHTLILHVGTSTNKVVAVVVIAVVGPTNINYHHKTSAGGNRFGKQYQLSQKNWTQRV